MTVEEIKDEMIKVRKDLENDLSQKQTINPFRKDTEFLKGYLAAMNEFINFIEKGSI